MLGERTSEEIKMAIGSAFPLPDEPHAEIRGRDLVSGLPKTVVVSSAEEIRKAIEEPRQLRSSTRSRPRSTRCPPELSGDIMDRGIVLTGGGALLQGPRRAAASRDRHADPHRRRPARLGRARRGQVRRGVRGAPAGADLRAAPVKASPYR